MIKNYRFVYAIVRDYFGRLFQVSKQQHVPSVLFAEQLTEFLSTTDVDQIWPGGSESIELHKFSCTPGTEQC